jgi:hypothetical protein
MDIGKFVGFLMLFFPLYMCRIQLGIRLENSDLTGRNSGWVPLQNKLKILPLR